MIIKPFIGGMLLSLITLPVFAQYESINTSLITPPATHPSLFFTPDELPAIKKRSQSLPWMRDVRREIKNRADQYMQLSSEPYQLVTKHNGFGTAGRGVQNFVGGLAFAGYLFDEPKYLEKAKTLLLAVVDQTEPSNSEHWRSHLQVSDATQGVVLGYDLVYPLLTEQERNRVLDEIEKFARELTHHKSAWGMQAPGVLSCNHNAVHYGALGLAALALWERNIPEKKVWLQRAIGRVDGYLDTFIDDTGYGTEGHHYYAYGLGGSTVFSWALKRANGPDLLAKHSDISMAADQVLWKLLPIEGRMLALNDNEEIPADVAGMAGTLTYAKPYQLWSWLESVNQSGAPELLGGDATTTYTVPFLFMWGDKPLSPKHPKDGLKLGHHFESGRVFLRSSWEGDDAAHFSLTSGYDFHRGHDHQDENSVTFFAYGEGFLIDPRYMPERSDMHTTLKVRGAEQIKGGDGRIASYREDPHGAFVQGQAEEAYDFDVQFVGYVDRKAYFVRGPVPYLVMRDDAQTEDDRPGEYISRYITYPDNTIIADGKAAIIKGERGKASAKLMVFSEGEQVDVIQDPLEGVTFRRRNKDWPYLDFLRRASATVNKVNPKFVTLLIPFKDASELPDVSVKFDKETDKYAVTVSFKGEPVDRFTLSQTDIIMQR